MATGDTIKAQFQDLADKAGQAENHDVRLLALQELSERPGVKTTEFYLSIFCALVGAILQAVPGREVIGAILIGVGTLAYNLSRGIAKKAALVFLALTFAFGGCTTKGYVKADALSGVFKAIRARHDGYVTADPSYDDPASPKFGQRASDLRDAKLMDETLDEALAPSPVPSPSPSQVPGK